MHSDGVQCAMRQSTRKGSGDVLEICGKALEMYRRYIGKSTKVDRRLYSDIGLSLQSAPADWWCLHRIHKTEDSSAYNRGDPLRRGVMSEYNLRPTFVLLPMYLRHISGAFPRTLTHCTLNSITAQFHTAPAHAPPLFVCLLLVLVL